MQKMYSLFYYCYIKNKVLINDLTKQMNKLYLQFFLNKVLMIRFQQQRQKRFSYEYKQKDSSYQYSVKIFKSMGQSEGFRTQQVGRFYIEFINRLIREDKKKVSKISELNDGLYLTEILSRVKGIEIEFKQNEQQRSFGNCLTNLKSILSQIEQYWVSVLKLNLEEEIDLVTAAKGNQQEIIKLVTLTVRTLFLSPVKEQFIQKILQTTEETQQFFMQLINSETITQNSNKILQENSNHVLLYRRLEDIEKQNQRLLKVIEEMQHQFLSSKQREKQNEQRLKQNQKEILILNEQVKVLRINAYENHQQILEKQHRQQFSNNFEQNTEQFKQREQKMLLQIQELKQLTLNQQNEIKKLSSFKTQLSQLKLEQTETIMKSQQLQEKLIKTSQKLQSVQNQLKFSQQTMKQNNQQIQKLRQSLLNNERTITQKNELIEQLQNNIKYLLDQTEPKGQKTSQSSAGNQKTTLKQQCQSTILNNRQHSILTKLTQENVTLARQLKFSQQIITSLQDQLLKMNHVQEQNQKLVQMINHMHKYRGEENQLLIKTIYQMRLKLLKNQIAPQNHTENHTLKDINRIY